MGLLHLIFVLRRSLRRAIALFANPRVPLRLKLIAGGLAVFIISPLNVLGDIPLVGILDDAALLGFLLNWFVRAGAPYEPEFAPVAIRSER
jgi:uncharacterized membrane protein YkvA (DUF1232 family)